jgi:hypothetical protein
MESIPKRIKGIEYPSSLSLVLRKKEYIADIDGYYKLLGLNPNEKNWGNHEIKEKFRFLIKQNGHDKKLIEAYKTLVGPKRIFYDSLTRSLERLIEELHVGKKKLKNKPILEETKQYAYYIDQGIEENYELALEWMKIISIINHRLNDQSPVRVVLSKKFGKVFYNWGEMVYVNTDFQPSIDVLAYFLLKDTKKNWFLDYCKIIRKWD